MGYVTEFIKNIPARSQIVAHQLIWNMQTNMYMDEDQQHKDRRFNNSAKIKQLTNDFFFIFQRCYTII